MQKVQNMKRHLLKIKIQNKFFVLKNLRTAHLCKLLQNILNLRHLMQILMLLINKSIV